MRPIGEIARLLGCSESTVNKEIAAIKRDLKEKLEEGKKRRAAMEAKEKEEAEKKEEN